MTKLQQLVVTCGVQHPTEPWVCRRRPHPADPYHCTVEGQLWCDFDSLAKGEVAARYGAPLCRHSNPFSKESQICTLRKGHGGKHMQGENAWETDEVNHPPHYTTHPSGIECIQVTEHMGFNLGNAVKYIWRADLKGSAIIDLEKAKWYVEREIAKRKKGVLP